MIKIYDVPTATQSILKRTPPDETDVPPIVLDRIAKTFGERISTEEAVRRILKDVRTRGDAALLDWSGKLDGFPSDTPLHVPKEQLASALETLPTPERDALELATERIRGFYSRQPLTSWFTNDLGGTLGQIIRPHGRVGLYVPGGTAPLPSSVLMSAVPAQVAGVKCPAHVRYGTDRPDHTGRLRSGRRNRGLCAGRRTGYRRVGLRDRIRPRCG